VALLLIEIVVVALIIAVVSSSRSSRSSNLLVFPTEKPAIGFGRSSSANKASDVAVARWRTSSF
jgi:hypothetical protein